MKLVGKITDIINQLYKLDEAQIYSVEIKSQKSLRSLQQNRFLWKLVHLIAKQTCQDDIDIYCTLLERADVKSDYILARPEIERFLRETYRGVQFIRQVEAEGEVYSVYKIYFGSSKMTKKEMNELLNIAIQLCSELDIPTERIRQCQ